MNKVVKAREFLEAQKEGYFEQVCDAAVCSGGVLVMTPDCFLAAVPLVDDPGALHVVFAMGELPVIYRVLRALGCVAIEWRRDFGHSERYGTRRRSLDEWGRKLGLMERLTK